MRGSLYTFLTLAEANHRLHWKNETWCNLPDSTVYRSKSASSIISDRKKQITHAANQQNRTRGYDHMLRIWTAEMKQVVEGEQVTWLTNTNQSRPQGDAFKVVTRAKLYLCHIDEWDSAVVLPHASSSSSQPEVKVHTTAASEDLCTSESSVCLFEVFRTTL